MYYCLLSTRKYVCGIIYQLELEPGCSGHQSVHRDGFIFIPGALCSVFSRVLQVCLLCPLLLNSAVLLLCSPDFLVVASWRSSSSRYEALCCFDGIHFVQFFRDTQLLESGVVNHYSLQDIYLHHHLRDLYVPSSSPSSRIIHPHLYRPPPPPPPPPPEAYIDVIIVIFFQNPPANGEKKSPHFQFFHPWGSDPVKIATRDGIIPGR